MKPTRGQFVAAVLGKAGALYRWGAKGPDRFDCSGLVTFCLLEVGGPDWRQTHNTDGLLAELPETHEPKPGDLCLYGPSSSDASHVMVWMGGAVFGASGGDSKTVSDEIARERRACVKAKSTHLYRTGVSGRSDFLGFRSLSQFFKE